MELACIINVLYNMLLEQPLKVSALSLDDPGDRVKLFKLMIDEMVKELNKE